MSSKSISLPDPAQATPQTPIFFYVPLALIFHNLSSLRECDKESDEFIENVLRPIAHDGQRSPIATIMSSRTKSHPVLRIIEEGPLAGCLTVDTEVELHDGLQRFTAFSMIAAEEIDPDWLGEGRTPADYQYIRAEYQGSISEYDRLRGQVSFNKSSVRTRPAEIAAVAAKLLSMNPMQTQAGLALDFGIAPSELSQILNINRLPPETRTALKEGKVTASNAMELGRLHKVPNLDLPDLVSKAKSMTVDNFKKHCEKIHDAYKKEREANSPGADVYVAPLPRPRKNQDILDVYNDEKRVKELGLDLNTLAWVVQQDTKTLAAHRTAWEERQRVRKDKKALTFIARAAKNYVEVSKDATIADIFDALNKSDHEDAPEVVAGLEKWLEDYRAGKTEIPGSESEEKTKSQTKGKGKGKKKPSKKK